MTVQLDLLQTLAAGAVVFACGVTLRRMIPILGRLNVPSAVVGGLGFALIALFLRDRFVNFTLDTTAQPLFMVAFFTSIGMGAGLSLLRKGGHQVVLFLAMSGVFCLVQNFIGMDIARRFGLHPLVGVIAGSVTLVGGPATGMAFAPLFERAGVESAGVIAIASATFGIVCGGLLGGPAGTWLVKRLHRTKSQSHGPATAIPEAPAILEIDTESESSTFYGSLLGMAVAMGLGSIVSTAIQASGITLPAYIGAMLVASVIRNLDEATGWLKLDRKAVDFAGTLSLNIFLVVALMNLRLWELAHLALPLAVILTAQVLAAAAFALIVLFRIMGRDYESAVMASGFIGFVLGTTANAVSNMRTMTDRFGPAPRAFLVVPIVGAFFIDFVNALIINVFLNW
jgi:glutamate:Na+ symporter, ESS family